MSQLSLPEIQSKLDLLLDSGKTIIALKAADSKDYPSIIDEFYKTHNITSDDEIISRMDEVGGMISKAFECSSAAKSILDMGPVLDSYLKNQEAKKVQKKKLTQPSVSVATNSTESVGATTVATAKKAKSTHSPTSMDSLNIKPSAIKILKLFVDGKKMDLIKDVTGFTESDIYQNFTSEYWKIIEQEWSPEAIKLITTINLTNCSLPKNLLFGLNTMLNEQNIAISASKFATLGFDPTYEDTALYQAIQNASKQTSIPKRTVAKSTTVTRQKVVEQTTPAVVPRRISRVIETPNTPVIPATIRRRQPAVEVTPEPQTDEIIDDYENLDEKAMKIEEFDSMDEQDLADPVDELVATQPIEEPIENSINELNDPLDDPIEEQDLVDPVDEPVVVQPVSTQRRTRVVTASANTIPLGGSTTRRRTSGMAQTSTRVIRRTN